MWRPCVLRVAGFNLSALEEFSLFGFAGRRETAAGAAAAAAAVDPMKVPPFSEFSKSCIDLLYGARSGGIYQYDQRLKVSSGKTADGLGVTATAIRKDGSVDCDVKVSLENRGVTLESVATSTSKVSLKASFTDWFHPGFKGSLSSTFPYAAPAKLGLEHSGPHFHVKGATDLHHQPKFDASGAVGIHGAIVGGEVGYDTQRQTLSNWAVGAGYMHNDYHLCAFLANKGQSVKMTYTQRLGEKSMLGAEVTKPLNGNGDAIATVGYVRLLDNGCMAKTKVNSLGICSLLWESKFENGKVALSGQFDANTLEKGARVGCSVELSGS